MGRGLSYALALFPRKGHTLPRAGGRMAMAAVVSNAIPGTIRFVSFRFVSLGLMPGARS